MDIKSKQEVKKKSRKEFIKNFFQIPEGAVTDYYHGNLIYRVEKNAISNKKSKEEFER